jgi:nicotinate phosphoribosyltransferase
VSSALLTDLYEVRMAASFRRRRMDGLATFSLFFRAMPRQRGFLVACGLEACLEFLADLAIDDGDLEALAGLGVAVADLDALRGLRFSGDVWAIPEGTIVFADEPVLEVTAPIAEAQLVETYLLNQITFATAVASKAARCVLAAGDAGIVDFAFRRTHGRDAAMAVARATAIVGFAATSNVEAARRFGLTATGTMAHSYVEAFPTEQEAFRAFAEDNPANAVLLVDTYDTITGVRHAIEVLRDLGLGDRAGIRIDSGDLAALSAEARRMLDAAGLRGTRVFASGSLDELAIDALRAAGAPIDAYGVGTKVGVSADAPSLESVYKLVEYGGRPVMKLSPEKATAPGAKQVFRGPAGDVVGLRDDDPPPGAAALLVPVMRAGSRLLEAPSLDDARHRFRAGLAALPADARRLRAPTQHLVRWTPRATALRQEVADALGGRERTSGV